MKFYMELGSYTKLDWRY